MKAGQVAITVRASGDDNYNEAETVTGLTLADTSSGVALSWSPVEGASNYLIYRNAKLICKTQDSKETAYTDIEAHTNGNKYTYEVAANTSIGVGKKSAAVSIIYLSAAKLNSISNAASGIKLTWTQNKAANGYYIYQKTSGGSYVLVKTISENKTTSWTDTKVVNGQQYTYKIRSYTKSVESNSTYSSAKTYCRLLKPKITSLKNNANKRIEFKFTKNAKGTGYKYEVSSNKSFTGARSEKSSSTSVKLSGATVGKTYYIRVLAYKKIGSKYYYSAYSSVKSVKIRK